MNTDNPIITDAVQAEPEIRAEANFALIHDMLARGDVEGATRTIQSMERQMDRDLGFGGVAEYLSQGGTFESVIEMLSHIEGANTRDDALVRIAEAKSRAGKFEDARAYLYHIEDLDTQEKEAELLGIELEGREE